MRARWLIVGLVVSLALNLFLLGLGAGVIAFGVKMARENAGARPAALFWATSGMAQPAKHDTRRMLLSLRDQVRPDLQHSRALRAQAWSALGSARPDIAAIKAALAQSRQIDIDVRAKVEDDVTDYVAKLPPADRAAYASGITRDIAAPAKP